MSNSKKPEEPKTIPIQGAPGYRSLQVIGPEEGQPECPPLRLMALPGSRVIEIRKPEVIIGRHMDSDIQLILADVSRKHCRLYYADNQWQVQDLGSLNGTRVNGIRQEHSVLEQNDVIRIAGYLFQVSLGTPEVTAAAAGDSDATRTHNILKSIAAMLPEDEPEEPRRKSA